LNDQNDRLDSALNTTGMTAEMRPEGGLGDYSYSSYNIVGYGILMFLSQMAMNRFIMHAI
jgi:hypothetical protein